MSAPVVIIGGGACGLTAALTLVDAGVDCVVLERDALPQGSTALSSGFIPACGTRWQRALGVNDSPEQFARDIEAKNHHGSDPHITREICAAIGPTLEWLADAHGIEFHVLEGFLYPGHSVARMHAVPEKTGAALMGRLTRAAEAAGVMLMTNAQVTDPVAQDDRIIAVDVTRPDGTRERIEAAAVLLACNGFGGNAAMVRQHIPEIAQAIYAGHAGNLGDALRWGEALGAQSADLSAYQGHGSWAIPHGALVTWALMMEGGVQINARGERFWNEHDGYSEASQHVIAQPGGFAWDLYDARLHALGLTFPDYAELAKTGAIKSAARLEDLARALEVPEEALLSTVSKACAAQGGEAACAFGRDFSSKPALTAPYYAVKVTGALFHTQGGLVVNANARVLKRDGTPFPNLYAGGGAARGVSGAQVWGYLSGNGLLTAVALARMAGLAIARDA